MTKASFSVRLLLALLPSGPFLKSPGNFSRPKSHFWLIGAQRHMQGTTVHIKAGVNMNRSEI